MDLAKPAGYINGARFVKVFFKSALHVKTQMGKTDYYIQHSQRIAIEKRLDSLSEYCLPSEHKELLAFQKRLIKYREYIFTFLYHPKVPPDNNASERAIRNIKVKQKVSGQF